MPEEDFESESLEAYWADVRAPRPPAEPRPPSALDNIQPGDCVIGTREHVLITIKPDGQLIYGEGYEPDKTAVIFWEAMGRRRLEMEERLLLFQHMESILTRLGVADLNAERLRLAANAQTDPVQKSQQELMAELAINRLNLICNEAIELGRGLARRDLPIPEVPAQIPSVIAENEASNYQGRDALPEDP